MLRSIIEFILSLFGLQKLAATKEDYPGPVVADVIIEREEPVVKVMAASKLPVLQVSEVPNPGAPASDIMILQRRLKELGFDPGPIDGIPGSKTLAAVKAFQKSMPSAGTGQIGPKTMEALRLEVKAIPVKPVPSTGILPSTGVQGPGRSIEKELEAIIDAKLLSIYPDAIKAAIDAKDGNFVSWLANEALEAMQVREATNNNDGKMVVLLQKTVGNAAKEAWCMAQQQSCIAYAETKIGIKSKILASETVMTVWSDSPKACRVALADAQRGDIVCWRHGTSWKGHTGSFGAWVQKLKVMLMIEGNTTSGKVGDKIVREGGGTYKTNRATGKIGDMTLQGLLRPF